ncbi:uncharacterized protein MONOS_14696 [Monocercomonoides exilis]|uniref:uncharacterized protein n=1 Tax=Monocercomonoides exilis TaxID=2049356 RepID=UPI003559E943|nr:hypothetical protein MONOS_14696 [Monocercomonoides exilis]|eukprot:MONOS_14696.1-p1 / transcript=MONOS_14696.1 / gene=MONOS_14696 / organism=Monocercomonoides_exilis_PA203 / gene_product=unspecified product / transcript_product=unspecified product / location=Mono_scaffold01053:1845-3665(+) / protein_length=406 / sequence_SO=supercontig / SO=protein_coding / is_pseudo=false
MNDMELMVKGIVAVLKNGKSQDDPQELNEGGSLTVQLKCCTLHFLLQSTPSEPSIISSSGSQPFSVSAQNTSIKNCGSSQSESGGCMTMRRSELFQLDFRPPYNQELAIWGCTAQNYADEQEILLLVIVYQSETIFASSSADNTSDSLHNLLVDEISLVSGEASIHDVWIKSLEQERDRGTVLLNRSIESRMNSLLTCASREKVELLTILFGNALSSPHLSKAVHIAVAYIQLQLSVIRPHSSQLQRLSAPEHSDKRHSERSNMIVLSSDGSGGHSNIQGIHLEFVDTRISSESLVSVECQDSDVEMNFLAISNTALGDGCAVSVASNASTFRLKQSSYQNVARDSLILCCFASLTSSLLLELENCSDKKCASHTEKGCISVFVDLKYTHVSSCAYLTEHQARQI